MQGGSHARNLNHSAFRSSYLRNVEVCYLIDFIGGCRRTRTFDPLRLRASYLSFSECSKSLGGLRSSDN